MVHKHLLHIPLFVGPPSLILTSVILSDFQPVVVCRLSQRERGPWDVLYFRINCLVLGVTIADEDVLAWLMPMWVVFSWCYWRWHGQDDVKYFLKCLHKSWCWRWLGTDNAPHSDVIVMTATPQPANLLSFWGILGAPRILRICQWWQWQSDWS